MDINLPIWLTKQEPAEHGFSAGAVAGFFLGGTCVDCDGLLHLANLP